LVFPTPYILSHVTRAMSTGDFFVMLFALIGSLGVAA